MRFRCPRPLQLARRVGLATVLTLALGASAASPDGDTKPERPKVGLLVNESKACKGYTLLASTFANKTYLIDMEGRVVQSWKSDCNPGLSAYLLDNGNLL